MDSSFRIFWESKKFEGYTDCIEPWYGTPYSVEKITASTIQVCHQIVLLQHEKLTFFLSHINAFLIFKI